MPRNRGSRWLLAVIIIIAVATYSLLPEIRSQAFAILSGLYGFVVAIIVFLDDRHGLGKYPKVTLILSAAAFFHLVLSVLLVAPTPQPA